MSNIVQPLQGFPERGKWDELISELYRQSDREAATEQLEAKPRKPLSKPEDISLLDDVMDALQDPAQVALARPVLRHALKEIARATLLKGNTKAG
jgi:hypothetical protein